MQEETEQKISKYNSGVAIQIRLDSLWKDANNHSRAGFFAKWNNDLDTIWRELARDIPKKDWEAKKAEFEKFETSLKNIGSFKDSQPEGFKSPDDDFWKNRDKHYKILMDKELFLKRLENEYGKGTAFDDGEDFDFE